LPTIVQETAGGSEIAAALSDIVGRPLDERAGGKQRIGLRADDSRRPRLDRELARGARPSVLAVLVKCVGSQHERVVPQSGVAIVESLGGPGAAVASIVSADSAPERSVGGRIRTTHREESAENPVRRPA